MYIGWIWKLTNANRGGDGMDREKFKGQLEAFVGHVDEYCRCCEHYKQGWTCSHDDCLLHGLSMLPTLVRERHGYIDKFLDAHDRAREAVAMGKKLREFPRI
jgi:hypothetical protein